jgi:hypothetical protein
MPGWGARATLELERILHKALQPDPSRRFSSAREFHDALSRVAGASPLGVSRAASDVTLRGRDAELDILDDALRSAREGAAARIPRAVRERPRPSRDLHHRRGPPR